MSFFWFFKGRSRNSCMSSSYHAQMCVPDNKKCTHITRFHFLALSTWHKTAEQDGRDKFRSASSGNRTARDARETMWKLTQNCMRW